MGKGRIVLFSGEKEAEYAMFSAKVNILQTKGKQL